MDDRSWDILAVEVDASFTGDLAADREAALREHIGGATFEEARAAVRRLVHAGQVHMPTPAEVLGALRDERREAKLLARTAREAMKEGTEWKPHQELIDADRERYGENPSPYLRDDCAGMMVVTDDDGRRPVQVECDACGFGVTVLQRDFGVARPSPPAVGPDPLEPSQDPLA